jgi:hypothetical protein
MKQHSEPLERDVSFTGEDLERLYEGTRNEWRPIDRAFAVGLFNKAARLVSDILEPDEGTSAQPTAIPLLDLDVNRTTREDILLRTSDILSVVLGATLVLIGTDE